MASSAGVSLQGQVSLPEQREAVLAQVERLEVLPAGIPNERFAAAPDPFYALEGREDIAGGAQRAAVEQGPAPVSDRVILREIAETLTPTGVMEFGQTTLLLFGERRVSVGDYLSVPHNGQTYQIEVLKADSRNFTLRLNNERISKRIQ